MLSFNQFHGRERGSVDLSGDIVSAILSARARSIMFIGGADTGKTTMAEAAVGLLSRKWRTGALDLDMGQSHIGPPTTLAWGVAKGGFNGWEGIKAEELYFTGSLSPPGNLLPSIAGARLLMDSALKRCEKLVIDTTGLITEPVGRIYKQYKIDILSPDIVIGIEKGDELGHILDAYRKQRRPRVIMVEASEHAVLKTVASRTEWRASKFREYFRGGRTFTVRLASVGLRYTGEVELEGLSGRLFSFRDALGRDMALGYIVGADLKKKKLIVRSPLKKGAPVASIMIGRASVQL